MADSFCKGITVAKEKALKFMHQHEREESFRIEVCTKSRCDIGQESFFDGLRFLGNVAKFSFTRRPGHALSPVDGIA